METDQPTPENSDQEARTLEDQGPSQVRSYECSFCKRGFSNAQALGGHMNIHRKDKAKLKQASNEPQQSSLDIPKMNPFYSSIPSNTIQPLAARFIQERSKIQWPAGILGQDNIDAPKSDETHVGEVQQLPLFGETPSNSEEQKLSRDIHKNAGEKGLSSGHGSSGLEVDLELRLGHKPQDS